MNSFIVLLIALACISYPAVSLAGDAQDTGASQGSTVKSSKSNQSERVGGSAGTAAEGTTVKGSKSNSSDRVGAAGGTAAEGTTVKSSKSNSQDRVGGGGGTEAGRSTVKSSKSNSSEITNTIKGSKSSGDN